MNGQSKRPGRRLKFLGALSEVDFNKRCNCQKHVSAIGMQPPDFATRVDKRLLLKDDDHAPVTFGAFRRYYALFQSCRAEGKLSCKLPIPPKSN